MVQFLPFWDDVTISFLAFSSETTGTNKKMRCVYLLGIDYLWLFYAPVNLTFFLFFEAIVNKIEI
jgi:hypothetical protein